MTAVLHQYFQLMRLNKPVGIFLLLWPCLIALWLASNGHPDLKLLVIFSMGVIVMRSCGCVINDYADRDLDAHVDRTKTRPLASNKIQPKQALILFAVLLAMAFMLVLQLRFKVILLSGIAALLAIIYPFTKRITNYPQVILGAAFAFSIPMAYMQIQGAIPKEAWVVFGSTMCWVVAYDTLYAMTDKADDLKIGIKSTAIAFGNYDKQIIFVLHGFALEGFAWIGWNRGFGITYYAFLLCALALATYQQYCIKDRIPAKCFKAFVQNNYFGAFIFIGMVLSL